jgi:hypothetical protein
LVITVEVPMSPNPVALPIFVGRLVSLGVFLSLVLVAPLAFAQERPSPIRLNNSQKASVHAGEVHVELVEGESVNRGVVVGIIQAPVSEVQPLVERCWEYGDWREALMDTSLIRRESSEVVICSGTAIVPFPARNRHGHFRVHNRTTTVGGVESFVSSFAYIEGSGNLEDMFGYWILQPYGANEEHTLLKHVLNVDIGGFLPGALVRWATRRTLPDTVIGIREQLNSRNGSGLSGPDYWRDHSYD